MSRLPRLEWLAWVLAWCAVRACLVLSFADVFGYGEEFEKACAAKAMIDGLAVPHHQLAYHYYEGGGFVVSHLDALAFLALGPSLLAVKLVALALGAAALAAGWLLCERAAGRGAARAFACLFTFAPATVQQLSLLALGIHFHALIFVALTLAGTLALFESRGEKKRVWFATGLAAGFGLYFSYVLVLTVAVCAAALVLGLRRELLRPAARSGLVAAGTGFLLGFAPWLVMFAKVGARVLDVHGTDVVEGGGDKRAMLGEFLGSVFVGRSPADLAALVVLLASPLLAGFALSRAAADGTRRAARLILAHGVLFAAAYLAGGFTVGRVYHYFLLNRLTPLWWFAVALTALGAAAAWRTRVPWKRAVAALAIAAQVACGMLDLESLASSAQPGARELPIAERTALLARMRGYEYGEYIRKIAPHLAGSQLEKTRVLLGFREDDPVALHAGIAIGLGDSEAALTVDELLARAREAGVGDVRGFLLGCGVMLRKLHAGTLAERAQAVAGYPEEQRDALYEALGNQGLGLHPSVERLEREIRVGLENALPESYFRGVGRRMYRVRGELDERGYAVAAAGPWAFSRERAAAFVATQPAQVREALLAGFDAARRADTLP